MIEDLALAISSRLVAVEDIYPSLLEYRMHQIKTTGNRNETVAIIYDGDQEVRREYGRDYHQVIAQAKGWIDEREALMSEYDLHTPPAMK